MNLAAGNAISIKFRFSFRNIAGKTGRRKDFIKFYLFSPSYRLTGYNPIKKLPGRREVGKIYSSLPTSRLPGYKLLNKKLPRLALNPSLACHFHIHTL